MPSSSALEKTCDAIEHAIQNKFHAPCKAFLGLPRTNKLHACMGCGLSSTLLEVLQHVQAQAEPTGCPSRALADTITGMGMTLAVMVGRLTALLALRRASPPTQLPSQR